MLRLEHWYVNYNSQSTAICCSCKILIYIFKYIYYILNSSSLVDIISIIIRLLFSSIYVTIIVIIIIIPSSNITKSFKFSCPDFRSLTVLQRPFTVDKRHLTLSGGICQIASTFRFLSRSSYNSLRPNMYHSVC